MTKTVNSKEFIEHLIKEVLRENPNSNIAVIGPSTLERDHSLLYFSEVLSNTNSNLLAVDLPQKGQNCYGALSTLKRQMQRLKRKYPHLKKPAYISADVYSLDEKLGPDSVDVIYDHNSLLYIVGERPSNMEFGEATKKAIEIYAKVARKNGKIIITLPYDEFKCPDIGTYWQDYVFDSLRKNELAFEPYFINKDLDLRERFPELTRMRGLRLSYHSAKSGPHYPCRTMVVAQKH